MAVLGLKLVVFFCLHVFRFNGRGLCASNRSRRFVALVVELYHPGPRRGAGFHRLDCRLDRLGKHHVYCFHVVSIALGRHAICHQAGVVEPTVPEVLLHRLRELAHPLREAGHVFLACGKVWWPRA